MKQGEKINITIGKGGKPGKDSDSKELTNGGDTYFGSFLAKGGKCIVGVNQTGNDGGCGGGGSGNSKNPGGKGGFMGSNGENCTYTGGIGQGKDLYEKMINFFQYSKIEAGAGGEGGKTSHSGGGGGGGVIIGDNSINASNGENIYSGKGGFGYGSGGGGGGYDGKYFTGGSGAEGVVYIEW